MRNLARRAKETAVSLAALPLSSRNEALLNMVAALKAAKAEIFDANQTDLKNAAAENLALPLRKRLAFDAPKLESVIDGLNSLAALPDPIGKQTLLREITPGLMLSRMTCPIGVIGIIFESRPDALVQIASLCIKSGNAALLKGGREAMQTNRALHTALGKGLEAAGIPADALGLLETREDVKTMLKLDEYIDLIIPRGSNEFVRYIIDHSRIPVLGHADGICHVFVDESADIDMAVKIAIDSKTQSVSVCNAMETLLVHKNIAYAFLSILAKAMASKNVQLLGCDRTQAIIPCQSATEADWTSEYLDYILSIRVVDTIDDAIAHINRYGSGHTDVIVTDDETNVHQFMLLVDSAGVYHNCSTRFADGFRYGFGAEVGISTGKIHARGPMGLDGLCTYKYLMHGTGQTVDEVNRGILHYTHKDL